MPPLVFNGITIQVRPSDQYLNATQMCKAGKKDLFDWLRLDRTRQLISALQKAIDAERGGVDTGTVIEVKRGGSRYSQGTWMHPDLAIHIGMWISIQFGVQVSRWVREWRAYSHENDTEFITAIAEIEPSPSTKLEKAIQSRLQERLGAQVEVETPAGYIDLLTEDTLIELKKITSWKSAIGQVQSYGVYYPNHSKEIHLFGQVPPTKDEQEYKSVILSTCIAYDIKVVFYSDDEDYE